VIDTQGQWPLRESLERTSTAGTQQRRYQVIEHKLGACLGSEQPRQELCRHTWVSATVMEVAANSEIAVTDRDYAAVRPNYAVPCINPCEYVPYSR